jgi:hypothetical protein
MQVAYCYFSALRDMLRFVPNAGEIGDELPSKNKGGRASWETLPHHERRFLQAIQLIIDSGKVRTAADLLKYCEQAREDQAVDYLHDHANDNLPPDLLFDAMCVHFRIVAHKRNSTLLRDCSAKPLAVLLPAPRHLLDIFIPMENALVLAPDGRHLSPNVTLPPGRLIEGTRRCREIVSNREVVVFEAFRERDSYFLPLSSADIIDVRLLRADARLILHLRPHRDPEDTPLQIDSARLHIL